MCVCHHCDNKRCVRPDHLFLGTYSDNMRDMDSKGRRGNFGERNHSKLLEVEVRMIRQRYERGIVTAQALADEYGVSQRAVLDIVKRKKWRHLL